jgi:hypothetical protein
MMMKSFGIGHQAWYEKYLGLLAYTRESKSKAFKYLRDRVLKRIQEWKEKALSEARKENLIKASYISSNLGFFNVLFDLTKGLCDQISSMICGPWWTRIDNENKVH